MVSKAKRKLTTSVVFLILFLCWTFALKLSKAPIGPSGSSVGFPSINGPVTTLVGGLYENWYSYSLFLGKVVLVCAALLFVISLGMLVVCRNMSNVNAYLALIPIYYLVLAVVFAVIYVADVNYAPVLINGNLQSSYPAPLIVLAMSVMGGVIPVFKSLNAKNGNWCFYSEVFAILIIGFEVFACFSAGIYWITDIIAGLLLGTALLFFYYGLVDAKCCR